MSKLLVFLALIAISLSAVQAVRPGCIRVWQHNNRRGRSIQFCYNHKDFRNIRFNDQASSYCVGKGANWRLYQHINYKGRAVFARAGTCGNLPRWFNDHLSSVVKSTIRRRTCRIVRQRKCRKVRRAPFNKLVTYNKSYRTRVRVIRRRRVRYRQPVCKNQRYRIKYSVPYRYRKKISYRQAVPYTKRVAYRQAYTVRQRRSRRLRKRVAYRAYVNKKFNVYYRVTKYKKYWQNYRSTCSKRAVRYYWRTHRQAYKSRCPSRRRTVRWRNRKVWVRKAYKVKYWTRRYVRRSRDCYKKVYAYKTKYKRVQVTKRVRTLVWVRCTVPCVKYRNVRRKHKTYYTKRYSCTKRRIAVRKYTVRKRRVVTRRVPVTRYKWQSYTKYYYVNVRRYRTRYRNVRKIRYVTRYRYVTAYKTRTAYRWATRVRTSYVWKYRWQSYVGYKYVTKTKKAVKRVPAYNYTTKCHTTSRRVCH